MDKEAKAILEAESLEVVADRGYFDSGEILACAEADITITLPKPMTSDNRVRGRFETVAHPFGTIKARMGATHFLMKRLPNVATDMSLYVLSCNLPLLILILATVPLISTLWAG